ncbi:XS domain containing protein [Trema orientale]|uniref:XS domain containing protein n=1 Tax=Trema orientale TaxID=63057 RepID=A0A2P5DSS2_TREOI|nr:XS domain containing protein [Trema orientale]
MESPRSRMDRRTGKSHEELMKGIQEVKVAYDVTTGLVVHQKWWLSAMLFEKAYAEDHHGKKEWYGESEQKSGFYAWIARHDDYSSSNFVGEYLRNNGFLENLPEIMEEELRLLVRHVCELTKRPSNDQEKVNSELESKTRELTVRQAELEKREAENMQVKFSKALVKEISSDAVIGVKNTMGKFDTKAFFEAIKRGRFYLQSMNCGFSGMLYSIINEDDEEEIDEEEIEHSAKMLFSLCEHYFLDEGWHPFRVIIVKDEQTVRF